MYRFVMNKNAQTGTRDHEVHNKTTGCPNRMPNIENQIDLGLHESCHGAIAHAKGKYPNLKIDGCYHCCNACHTS